MKDCQRTIPLVNESRRFGKGLGCICAVGKDNGLLNVVSLLPRMPAVLLAGFGLEQRVNEMTTELGAGILGESQTHSIQCVCETE